MQSLPGQPERSPANVLGVPCTGPVDLLLQMLQPFLAGEQVSADVVTV